MTTDIYQISNSKIICRVLPFFARGKKMVLFLESVASPLINLHKRFLAWAYKVVLKTKVTSQTDVLVWYLNHLFSSRFNNPSDTFVIEQESEITNLVAFNYQEIAGFKMIGVRIYDTEEEPVSLALSRPMRDIKAKTSPNAVVIHAPKLIAGDYGELEYVSDIMSVVNEYKTSFVNFVVKINEN